MGERTHATQPPGLELLGKNVRLAIVASRWNDNITNKLVKGVLDGVEATGGDPNLVQIYWVPGSFELAGTARRVVDSKSVDAVICLGAILRGGTPHFEYVCQAATSGISALASEGRIPVIFGVLTCDTAEQAHERSGESTGNKGYECALAAIEMVDVWKKMR
jgi:6,7-dimethyl-8-ribityllumazine synthase